MGKKVNRSLWRQEFRKKRKKDWYLRSAGKKPFRMTYEDFFQELQAEEDHFWTKKERKETDRKDLLSRYRRIQKGKNPDYREIASISSHGKRGRVKTVLLPAPWSMVVAFSFVSAVASFTTKIVIYETFGKPNPWTPSHESIARYHLSPQIRKPAPMQQPRIKKTAAYVLERVKYETSLSPLQSDYIVW